VACRRQGIGDAASYKLALVRVIGNYAGIVESADFSPTGELIVTASADKKAQIWTSCDVCGVPLAQLLARAKAHLASTV